MKILRAAPFIMRITTLNICLITTACSTLTQQSAVIISQSPQPSPINNFQIVTNDLYRSGQPKGDADWDYLKNIGVTTVVRLNRFSSTVDEAEEFRLAKDRNIKVIPIYMQPEDIPHNWSPWASPDEKDIKRAIGVLEDKSNGKVLVHCSHGKDRTGLVVAVYSIRNKNYCKDAAYQQMKFYGASPFLFGIKSAFNNINIKENQNCIHDYK